MDYWSRRYDGRNSGLCRRSGGSRDGARGSEIMYSVPEKFEQEKKEEQENLTAGVFLRPVDAMLS